MNRRRAGTSSREIVARATKRGCVLVFALAIAGATWSPVILADAVPPEPRAADDPAVKALLLPSPQIEEIRKMGPGVLPAMARVYERSGLSDRATIANAFYVLGWKSPDAKRVLMQDAHTGDSNLRLQVQWALGRVSNDADVVDVLLDNMQNDGNPLFRDKAACALAYDQIHIDEKQKARVYEGLIQVISNPEEQVQAVSIQALSILTGQTKGFHPAFPPDRQQRSIEMWERWLTDFKSNL